MKKNIGNILLVFFLELVFVSAGTFIFPVQVFAIYGPPHNAANNVLCIDCHALHGTGDLLPRDSVQENICKSCHNPTGQASGLSNVSSHTVNGGTLIVDCGSCHNPHGAQTPTVDTHVGGVTAQNIKLIRSDTTKYVGDALSPVIFQNTPNHFVFNTAPYNGICQSCHSNTSHHRNDGTVDVTHHSGENCLTCHPHDNSFAPNCNSCHGYPPVVSNPQSLDGLVLTPAVTGSVSAGAHSRHATSSEYNFSCDKCHFGGMPASPISGNNMIQIGFNVFGSDGTGVTYDGQALNAPYNYEATSNTTVTTLDTLTCSNLYCHGNYSGSGINASPSWDTPSSGACGTCHGASNDVFPASGGHEKHVGNLKGVEIYNREYPCKLCHEDIADGSGPASYTVINKSKHVNNLVDWKFNTADSRLSSQSAYSIASGTVSVTNGTTPRAYGTCSNLYCHSIVQTSTGGPLTGLAGEYTTPTWGGGASTYCEGCHVPAGGSTTMHSTTITSGSHAKHLISGAGQQIRCATCHDWNGNGGYKQSGCKSTFCHGAGITGEKVYHVNGSVDVILDDRVDRLGTSAVYNGTTAPGDGFSTCSDVYCHTNGQRKRTGVQDSTTTPAWGTANPSGCHLCHGNTVYSAPNDGMPNYTSGSPKENGHQQHVLTRGIGCTTCHSYTTHDDGLTAEFGHTDDYYRLLFPTSPYRQYNGVNISFLYYQPTTYSAGYCRNVTCHPDSSTVYWGVTRAPSWP